MSRRSAMAGESGTHTQQTGMMTIEVTTYEEERVEMRGYKLVHVFVERDVNGVITVWWTVQYTYKHEVGVAGEAIARGIPGDVGE